jgi:AdoMet-dependent rRNA methyltransferase SPB1
MTPEEGSQRQAKKQKLMPKGKDPKNPLIHRFADEPTSAKTARWFSNPLFTSIGQAAELAQEKVSMDALMPDPVADDDAGSDSDVDEEASHPSSRSRQGTKQKKSPQDVAGLDPEEILAMIPKTDKQKRHEKRLKAMARDERRQARKAKKLGEAEGEFSLVPAEDEGEDADEIAKMEGMSEEKKQKLQRARDLIKAGMGAGMNDSGDGSKPGFEIVEAERPLPVMDDRRYDSDHEEYDSDDYAKTMALGTMMLRKSKAKALVDASYNRYAWNDPEGLPEWFVDDESRHYRPQLPIPPALLQKMKDKQTALSVRPIAKVAEARARKNRNAKHKLAAAKKKAQALVGSSDMSEAMKLKQISKALRSADVKKGGREKIVSKKGRKGVKGASMVDKRMKCDTRSMKRAEEKKRGRK